MKRIFIFSILLLTTIAASWAQPLMKIRDLKGVDANGTSTMIGIKVTVRGIVLNPTPTRPLQFAMYDSTGAITVISQRFTGSGLQVGDSVEISGKIAQFTKGINSGITFIGDTLALKLISQGNTIKLPKIVSKLNETLESDFVQADSVYIKSPAQWKPGINPVTFVTVMKGKDSLILRISNQIFNLMPNAPKGLFSVRGIVNQSDLQIPLFDRYDITPRDTSDFDIYTVFKPKLYKIAQVKSINKTNGVADSVGLECYLKGVVQSPNMAQGKGMAFSIFDNTGSIMIVNNQSNFGYIVQEGDSLKFRGTVQQVRGFIQFVPDSMDIISQNHPVIPSKVVTAFDDALESGIITLNNVYLKNPAQWDTIPKSNKLSFVIQVTTNGTDSFTVVIQRNTPIYFMNAPKGRFNITGIEGQNDNFPPFLSNYYLLPRYASDIFILPEVLPLLKIVQVKGNDINGENMAAINKVKCYLKGIVYSGNFSKNGLQFSLIDNTGAITVVSGTSVSGYNPVVGDSIIVRGQVLQLNGLAIIGIDSVRKISTGNTTLRPNVVRSFIEADESYLRQITNVKLKNPAQWDAAAGAANGGFLVTFQDTVTADTFPVWVDANTDLFNEPAPTSTVNITGIVYQRDLTSPYFENYYLAPRNKQDVVAVSTSSVSEELKNSELIAVKLYPNPATEKLNISVNCKENNINAGNIKIFNSTGQQVYTQILQPAQNNQLQTIDVAQLPKGIYILQINQGSFSSVKSFVKN